MAAHLVPGADGASLNVRIDGPADAPVTVVLVHGWTLDLGTWGPVAESLLATTPARVVRYDHRGHGRSAAVDESTMTIEQAADDLAAVLDQVAPSGPLVLAGHSMGGMTIMALAEQHPHVLARVAGVALVSTASGGLEQATLGLPGPGVVAFRAVERRLYPSRRWRTQQRLGNPTLLRPALRWLLVGPSSSPEAVRITVETVAACRPLTVSGFRATLEAHDRDVALAAFREIPTVVLVGSRDKLTPVRYARRLVAALPNAWLTVYPGAGHMLPVERVTAVSARIRGLVDRALVPAPTPATP
ncbi:alpha/beta fold hydrolase [Pseudonocardia sp. GCM10023141]|uniref:alpha/beta fold hydrolase n=1 Tax=Pseudonocardia sp. GCM10023141 TaxID=3252653 RepID=UPI00360FA4D5